MRGTNATTGKELSGLDHLKQSVRDILTTPIGSRVLLRDYGSRLFELVDAPLNEETIMELYAATIEALHKWEPRIEVTRVFVEAIEIGKVIFGVEAKYLESGATVTIGGIKI